MSDSIITPVNDIDLAQVSGAANTAHQETWATRVKAVVSSLLADVQRLEDSIEVQERRLSEMRVVLEARREQLAGAARGDWGRYQTHL